MLTKSGFSSSENSMLADYESRMSEAIVRHRADLEVRAARIEAELAIKARSEFLANMNHELRTPLNAIIGFATMLREGEGYDLSDEQRASYAEYILQSGDLLLGHINTLLEVAALESGGVSVNEGVVLCKEMVSHAISRAKIQAAAAKVRIDIRESDEEVEAWGDPARLAQAVDHVLQTAIKSCAEGGRILVRARRDEWGDVEIAVRDNGAGYTDEEIKDALAAFTQVHRGLDRSFSGPGVGLAVAKTFIELQNGKLTIKSRPGQGTLVQINIPSAEGIITSDTQDADAEMADDSRSMEKKYDAA